VKSSATDRRPSPRGWSNQGAMDGKQEDYFITNTNPEPSPSQPNQSSRGLEEVLKKGRLGEIKNLVRIPLL